MIMNFGKYKGASLREVPTGYLQGLLQNTKDPKFALAFSRELTRRNEPLRFVKKGKARKKPRLRANRKDRKVRNSFFCDFSLPNYEDVPANLTHLQQRVNRRARRRRR